MGTTTLTVSRATAPQRRFWADPAKFRAMVGGVGSGKTYAGCVEVLRQPAGSVGMILAPTYPMLRDSTLRSLLAMVEAAGVLADFHRGEMRMELRGRRTILLRTADRPDRLRGPNLGWFWADEGAMLAPAVWDLMLGRLRESPGRGWVTTTPRGRNWVYSTFAATDDPDYAIFKAPTRTNTFNPESFAATLEARYDSEFALQELEGEFLADPSGRLILPDWLDVAALLGIDAPARHDPIAHGQRRISCDPSEGRGADRSVIVVRDDVQVLHAEASPTMGPLAISDRIQQLRTEWKVAPTFISIDGGGGAGRETAAYLANRHKIHAKQVFGSSSGGLRFFNLRSLAAWRFREAMQAGGFGLARFGALLPDLRKEIGMLSYSMVGDKLALRKKDDLMKELRRSPDLSDCLIQSFSYS